jgi:hypothetical protein
VNVRENQLPMEQGSQKRKVCFAAAPERASRGLTFEWSLCAIPSQSSAIATPSGNIISPTSQNLAKTWVAVLHRDWFIKHARARAEGVENATKSPNSIFWRERRLDFQQGPDDHQNCTGYSRRYLCLDNSSFRSFCRGCRRSNSWSQTAGGASELKHITV